MGPSLPTPSVPTPTLSVARLVLVTGIPCSTQLYLVLPSPGSVVTAHAPSGDQATGMRRFAAEPPADDDATLVASTGAKPSWYPPWAAWL